MALDVQSQLAAIVNPTRDLQSPETDAILPQRGVREQQRARRVMIVDALVSFSLANLMFLRVWRELLFLNDVDAYWVPDYTQATFGAVILNVTCFAITFFTVSTVIRRVDVRGLTRLGRIGFLLLLVFPLDYLRTVIGINSGTIHWLSDHIVVSVGIGLFVVIFGVLALWRLDVTASWVRIGLLIFVPFAFMNLISASYKYFSFEQSSKFVADIKRDESRSQGKPQEKPFNSPRIIWILFDELDSRFAFLDRPSNVRLPNFDKLTEQSLVSLNCNSHGMSTSNAIPSFLLGTIVSDTEIVSKDELNVKTEDNGADEFTPFSSHPTFFGAMKDRGKTSAIIGMYHPYHRLLGDNLDYCSVHTTYTYAPTATNSVGAEAFAQLLGITPVYRRINAIRTYKDMLDDSISKSSDSSYDLVYVHASVPHGPWIYDRKANRFDLVNLRNDGYLDNLVLADRFLGEVRTSMEKNRIWDDSVVLITSDHELRKVTFGDKTRVGKTPFIIKMPGQKEGLVFERAFSPTLITKDLLLDIVDGKVRKAADVIDWLEKNTEQD